MAMPHKDDQAEPIYCRCCERELNPVKIVWLELSFKTGKWYDAEHCPAEESQGHFPFGAACAKKIMKLETTE